MNAVLRALLQQHPDLQIQVRTAAPAWMFGRGIAVVQAGIEPPVAEADDALSVDIERTAAGYRELLSRREAIVETEVSAIQQFAAELVFADIPFLAGDIARSAGLPCVGMTNFTWNWILDKAGDEVLLNAIREGYGHYRTVFRLPLSHAEGWDVFPEVVPVPFVTPRSERPRNEIREELNVREGQNVVLVSGRARLPAAVLERVRAEVPNARLVGPDALPCYSDIMRASDIVVSKNGYSIAAECIAEGLRLLYPVRSGWREEAILKAEVPRYTPALEIPQEDWAAGNWRCYLQSLQSLPAPAESPQVDGAQIVADYVLHSR